MSQSTQSLRRGAAKFILATPPLRKVFVRLALDENVLMCILEDPIFTYRVLDVKPIAGRMANILDHPKLFEHYLTSNRVHDRLLSNEAFLDRLGEEDALVAKLAKSGGALSRLARDPDAIAALLIWPEVVDAAAADSTFVSKLLAKPNVMQWILSNELLVDRLIADGRVAARMAHRPEVLKHLFRSPEVIEPILSDTDLLDRLFADSRAAARGVASQAVAEARLSSRDALARLLSDDRAIEHAAGDREFVRALFGHDRALATIAGDEESVSRLASDKRFLRTIVGDAVALNTILSQPRARDVILADARLMGLLLHDERGVASLLSDAPLLKRIANRGELIDAVLASPHAVKTLLEDHRAVDAVASNADVLDRVLQRQPALEHMLTDERLIARMVTAPGAPAAIAANAGLVGKLVTDEGIFDRVENNPAAVDRLLALPLARRRAKANPNFVDSIVLTSNTDPRLARKMKVLGEFDDVWSHLAPSVEAAPNLAERVALARERLKGVEDVPAAILDLLCDGDHIQLPGARLEFADRRSLWVVLNEILIEEEYFFETKSTAPRILDCGTHFGMAVYYFKRLYPDARITAFEPLPRMFSMAQRNIESNAMHGVELLPYALSDYDGETTFHISESDSMAGSLTMRRRQLGDHLVPVKVQCRKLSAWLDEPVHFLKVDIEGSEDVVLAEAASKLQNVQHIFCEYHHGAGLEPERLPKLLSILNGAGFDVLIGPSYAYAQTSRRRSMRHTGLSYSLVLWARNRNWS